jgi:hypothetical protein
MLGLTISKTTSLRSESDQYPFSYIHFHKITLSIVLTSPFVKVKLWRQYLNWLNIFTSCFTLYGFLNIYTNCLIMYRVEVKHLWIRLKTAEICSIFLFYGRKGEIQYQGQVSQQLIEQRSLHIVFQGNIVKCLLNENLWTYDCINVY